MFDDQETDKYEVGYRKPPRSGQFRKGVSGNPLGRPKKASDFDSELLRQMNSTVTINENGKRTAIKKSEALAKRLFVQAWEGNTSAIRHLVEFCRQAHEKEVARHEEVARREARSVDELTDEELMQMLRNDEEEKAKKAKCPICSCSIE